MKLFQHLTKRLKFLDIDSPTAGPHQREKGNVDPYLLPAVTVTKKRGGGALSPWWPVPREWHPNDLWLVRSPFILPARRDRYSLMAGHPGNRSSSVAIPRGRWTLSFESNNFSPLHQSRTWFSFVFFSLSILSSEQQNIVFHSK